MITAEQITFPWHQLPLDMKHAIVEKLDARSRVKLSMCSEFENQLVRRTKRGYVQTITLEQHGFRIVFDEKREQTFSVFVRPEKDGGAKVYVNIKTLKDEDIETYSTTDWKETIMNIMSVLGTKVKMERLYLNPTNGFQERLNWFLNNIQIEPLIVKININQCTDDCYEESIFYWPSNCEIWLDVYRSKLPNLERLNIYDEIALFWFEPCSEDINVMTDEAFKKFRNARFIRLIMTDVTLDGVQWFLKKWLNGRQNLCILYILFKEWDVDNYSLGNVTRKLADVIRKSEPYMNGNCHCWKIYKNENVVGILWLTDNLLYFSSSPRLAEKILEEAKNGNSNNGAVEEGAENRQVNNGAIEEDAENGNNNDGAIEEVAENGNLLINDELIEEAAENGILLINDYLIERNVEMGNVPRQKKSSRIIICFHFFSFFLPLTFILIFCLLYQKIKL